MIKVLVDTNVIVNYLTHREDKYRESLIQVMEACSAKELEGYVAFHQKTRTDTTSFSYGDEVRYFTFFAIIYQSFNELRLQVGRTISIRSVWKI